MNGKLELFVFVHAVWEGRWSPQTVDVNLKESKEREDEGVKQEGWFRRKLNWIKTGRCEWIIRLELLRPGVLCGREDEVQPLQGVHSLMAELLPLEQLDESAVKLVQLRLLDLPGNDTPCLVTIRSSETYCFDIVTSDLLCTILMNSIFEIWAIPLVFCRKNKSKQKYLKYSRLQSHKYELVPLLSAMFLTESVFLTE